MNLNVRPEKLREFAQYVGSFSRGIAEDCQGLATALQQLGSCLSASERSDIEAMVKEIIEILKSGQPTLKELKSSIDGYADYVEEFQRRAKG